MSEIETLIERIREVTGWRSVGRPTIFTDTSDPFRITRGSIIRLDGRDFVVRGYKHESRFGIADQFKYWVFSTIELVSGEQKIIKTVFNEDFNVHIGLFKIHCYRSPDKEANVLDLVRGDRRFMQGYSVRDDSGSNVRILDYIKGPSILEYIYNIEKSHERYFHEDLPQILRHLAGCIEAIEFLHDRGTCHGDIRNDHIIIDAETGEYRWIDFDLNQHVSDYDMWSIGNIINYAVGKGITTFSKVLKDEKVPDRVKAGLSPSDASAFYEYRIMNLKRIYPYLPKGLSDILLHFTVQPKAFYTTMQQLHREFREMLDRDFPVA